VNNLTGGGLLAKTLQAAGVTEVFSLHGGHLDSFLIACKDHGIRLTDTRHEASAGHAAEAYARATGKIGVAVVTAGPGFANAYTAMANAYVDRMPVLFIVGAPSSREADLNTLQGGIDQIAAASHVTKWTYRISNGARVPEIVEQAIRRAMSGAPGPVLLEIPIEVMFTPVKAPERAEKMDNFGGNAGAAPSSAQIAALLDLLQEAERPVVIAGGGATLSRCAEALAAFAELAQVPVVTGTRAEGLMPQESEFYGGSSMSVPVAAAMGAPADVVLLLGVRIGLFTGGRYGLISPDAKVAQIDIDGAEPGRGGPIGLAVTADCRTALLEMTLAARQRRWPDRRSWAAKLQMAREIPNQQMSSTPIYNAQGLLHPYHAAKALAAAIPENAVIVCDGGESSIWMRDHIRPRGTGSFHTTGYLGALGVGQGFAIGAARAFPDRPVILFAGDGAVGFHISEFDTMLRHGLNIHTVVLNNACWGMSQNGQDLIYGKDKRAIVSLRDTDYEKVAAGFGGFGARAGKVEEIGPAVLAALSSGRPSCINVRIDGDIINPVTARMVGVALPPAGKAPEKATTMSAKPDKVVMPYYENVE
jgi:acetolactate synthase-1/2/3 large subunit